MGAYESGASASPADSDLILVNVPGNISVVTNSPKGHAVSYVLPTTSDEVGETSATVAECFPASGSTFPIGTTTVTCAAIDSDDSSSPVTASFTVTVQDIGRLLRDMITQIHSLHLGLQVDQRLVHLLHQTLRATRHDATEAACGALARFVDEVEAQSGRALTQRQARVLLAEAQPIQAAVGCRQH